MMKFDNSITSFIKGVKHGTYKIPDFVNNVNPPSLWAYYLTMPQWARDHPAVRNVMMAYEYH